MPGTVHGARSPHRPAVATPTIGQSEGPAAAAEDHAEHELQQNDRRHGDSSDVNQATAQISSGSQRILGAICPAGSRTKALGR